MGNGAALGIGKESKASEYGDKLGESRLLEDIETPEESNSKATNILEVTHSKMIGDKDETEINAD